MVMKAARPRLSAKEGTFPAPKKLGKNSTAWILAEVEEWARMRSGLGGSGGVER